MVVPTGLFQVITGIYMPINFKGLDRRPFDVYVKNGENFARLFYYLTSNLGLLLGLALMLNNLPNGVAAAMIKLPLLLTTLAVGFLSVLTFWVGLAVGRAIGSFRIGPWTWVASGLLLMGLGLAEVILALPIRG